MKFELHLRHVIECVEFDGYSWFFRFSGDEWLRVGCLWRILGNRRILLTSEDHGQMFGLDSPIDARLRAAALLTGEISTVWWDNETGDLNIAVGDVHLQESPTRSDMSRGRCTSKVMA